MTVRDHGDLASKARPVEGKDKPGRVAEPWSAFEAQAAKHDNVSLFDLSPIQPFQRHPLIVEDDGGTLELEGPVVDDGELYDGGVGHEGTSDDVD